MFQRRASWTLLLRTACLAAPLLVAACGTPVAQLAKAEQGLFDDAAFAPSTEPVAPADVFRVTPQMQAYIDTELAPMTRLHGLRSGLVDALYARGQLKLEYEASVTRNAGEAFEARQGNCLSLVIMTGAFAKAMGLTVRFQQVSIDEMWSRTGDLYFMSGHVNVQLQRESREGVGAVDRSPLYTIDFLPPPDVAGLHVHEIEENTVLAMYLNNRAAEALVVGRLDDAYWRARDAMRLDPKFLSAYNTLAVIYLRRGEPARAARVLQAALAESPDNPRMLSNYAQALRLAGRLPEADAVQSRLARLEPYPPFFFYNRGQAAMRSGDLATARTLFQREIEREPDYHEFHYALATADFGLGRLDEARSELAVALENAVRRTDHDLYAAKLDRLKSSGAGPGVPQVFRVQ
jgi:Tfp pilus assembly protein PilF